MKSRKKAVTEKTIKTVMLRIILVMIISVFICVSLPTEINAAAAKSSKDKYSLTLSNIDSNRVIKKGATLRIKYKATRTRRGKIYGTKVRFRSSNKKIATVSSKGVIKAKKNGVVVITVYCKYKPKMKKTVRIRVGTPVNKIAITGPRSMLVGRSVALKAATNSNASNKKIKWYSANSSIVRVAASGKVTAVGRGNAIVYAKALDGSGVKASYRISVRMPVKNITITGPQYVIAGRSYTLNAATNKDAAQKSVSWSSNNPSAVSVNNTGKITAVGNGVSTIYVKALDGSGVSASYKVYSHNYTAEETKWIAHRGLHTKELENTAAAFRAAGETGGFWGCECDIRETKHDDEDDFDIVISHDSSYERVFGVAEYVNEVTADELRNSTDNLKNVCFFTDYLSICEEYGMVPVVELKGDLGFSDAAIEKAVKQVDDRGLLQEAYFISFDAGLLERLKIYIEENYDAEPYYGYLLGGNVMAGIDLACQKGFSGINLSYPELTPEVEKKCNECGLKLSTWTYRDSDASRKAMYEHLVSDGYSIMSATTDVDFFR